MSRKSTIGWLALALLATGLLATKSADAADAHRPIRHTHWNRGAAWHNANRSWHGGYANVQWGRPLALIVPPTVNMQTEYAWGVGRNRMVPIHHQFARPYALSAGGGDLRGTPPWPSDTRQFGTYYVRGPW